MPNRELLRMLAASFLAGEPIAEEIFERGSYALGRKWPWLRAVAKRYVAAFRGRARPRNRDVVRFLREDQGFQRAWIKHSRELSVKHWMAGPLRMQPAGAAAQWNLPAIESVGALAEWLGLGVSELDWFADLKGLEYKKSEGKLRHYHYRMMAKQFASIRLIEAPKPRLKAVQRQILSKILERVPAHTKVHGFVKGRSVKGFVAPHVGRRVVLRMDLRDFFPSISGARVQAVFRTLGYPEPVADLLGGICTNAAPRDVWKDASVGCDGAQLRDALLQYSRPHLPQGAPTSPMLANLRAWRADCRLAGLARAAGAEYTRYADDLAFSGGEEFERRVERFSTHVAVILGEEGFHVHHRKTRAMRQGVRQHLAGVVVNRHANVMRTDFDRLKATLTNCVRLGADSQNREGHKEFRLHLEGRVSFVESVNESRGRKLRAIYKRIRWG
jgi:RNA-directed DNA polymerase